MLKWFNCGKHNRKKKKKKKTSDSVKGTGEDDLRIGPRWDNSGMEAKTEASVS